MARSKLVKVRVTDNVKSDLFRIADRRRTTVSAILRDLISEVASGRSANAAVRGDMIAVRHLANVLLACADTPDATDAFTQRLTDTARRLKEVSSRHLGPAS